MYVCCKKFLNLMSEFFYFSALYVQGTPCPEKTFYSECNQCFCSKNGVSAACTLILCDALRKIDEKQNEDTAVVVVD